MLPITSVHVLLFALLETVFHVADIFSDFGYSIYSTYSLLCFPSTIDVIFFFVFCLLWLTSYYVVHAYCVVHTIHWVGGVDVCMQCGQSIVCLRLFRGHTCVCSSCWMPE